MIKWSLEKKVLAGFMLALIMLAGVGYLSLKNITALIDSDRWVSHTYNVLSEANATTASLQALSDGLLTSEHNFVTDGSQSSLQPVQQGINEVSSHVRELGRLTVDNPAQQARVAALQSSLLNLQDLLLNLVTTYNNQGRDATSQLIAQNIDTRELQNLRSTLTAIQNTANTLLQQRTAAAQNSVHSTTVVMITAVLMVFIFLSFAYYFIRRDVRQRQKAEEALHKQTALYESTLQAQSDLGEGVLVVKGEKVIYINDTLCELVGYSRSELADVSALLKLVPPEHRASSEQRIQAWEHGEDVQPSQIVLIHKNGKSLDIESSTKVLEIEGVAGRVTVIRNITARKEAEQALRESEIRFRLLAENMNDMVALIAPTGQYLYASPSSKQHLGYEPQELLARNVFRLIFAEDAEWVEQEFQRALAKGDTSITLTFRMCTKSDGYIWVETLARFTYGRNGEPTNIQVTSRDVTERKRAEEALVASEKKFRLLIQGATDGVVLIDRKGNYTDGNDTACRVLGYTLAELLSLNATQVIAPEDLAHRPLLLDRRDARKGLLIERVLVRKDGTRLPVEISGTILDDGTMQAIVRDVTERKRAEVALQALATLDPLTGLLNRREMDRVLDEEVARGSRYGNKLSVVMVDLDHFKTVNDRYGHKVGDEVIRWAGRMFADHVRATNRVARYGGEELALILPETCLEDACRMAERFRANIAAHPFTTETRAGKTLEIPITTSMGVAELPRSAATAESLLVAADIALYKAKRLGRNRVVPYEAGLSELVGLRATGKLEAAGVGE